MIQKEYNDGKKHIHILSYGAGTQSTALLLMALKGEINGVIPDYIIFSDTGWEPKEVYSWLEKVNSHIKKEYNREIIITNNGSIKKDILATIENGDRLASLPFYTLSEDGEVGMVLRQCTSEYKIKPVKNKIRELLGYQPRQRVKEMIHIWKGISTDEVQRVKPIPDKWITAEHPLIDIKPANRTNCVAYVQREGLGTPPNSSCIGCPFHDDMTWAYMKKHDKESFADAVELDKKIRKLPGFKHEVYLHRSCKPLGEIDFGGGQMTIDDFINECEGFCGV